MPDKRKKKAREDAIEMLKQKAANNGLKNQAQTGAKLEKSNRPRQSVSTSQTSNSSTAPRNTTQSTMRGSQSPSAVNSLFKETARKATGNDRRGSATVRRGSRGTAYTPTRRTTTTTPSTTTATTKTTPGTGKKMGKPSERVQAFGALTKAVQESNFETGIEKQEQKRRTQAANRAKNRTQNLETTTIKKDFQPVKTMSASDKTKDKLEQRREYLAGKNYFLQEHPTSEWAKQEAYGALTGFNASLASTADFLLPDVITPKKVQGTLDYYRKANEEQQERVKQARGGSWERELAGNVAVNAVQQIPTATMAMLSGGSSLAVEGASLLNPSTLTHTGNVITRALGQVAKDTGRNPMFWETFLRTAGDTYDREISNGASPIRATLSAYANGLLNAQIEVGGGVEVYDPSEDFLKALYRSGKEENLEEVAQYAVENLVNKAIGSNGRYVDRNLLGTEKGDTTGREFQTTPWFSMKRGQDAVINPIDMAEQGFYGAIGGGLAGGGRTLSVDIARDSSEALYRNAHPDIEAHAQELINRASVQGREGERASNAEMLAEKMKEQISKGEQISTRQVMELDNALGRAERVNAQDYERRNREQYQQAVSEGRADRVKQQGTLEERQAANSKLDETITRNYERAKAVMGENASEQSVKAVANFMTGSTDNADIDTILTDTEAKKAVEKLSDVKLSVNNQAARNEIENLALTHQIENRDTILKEAQETVRTERKNMSKRGGELFDENYDHAMEVLNVPNRANIYESFFSRFYTDGTVKGANFDDSYNRIMSNVREDFGDELAGRIGEVFNLDFAQKVFTQGQMAQAAYNAKYQGKTFALKASENPAGFTYEDSARAKISDKQANLLAKFAERANVHIRLVDSIEGGRANGKYEDGVIVIAADTSNKLVTVAKHELTHHIRSTSPELYQKLEDFIFNKYYEWDADALENKIREYQARGYKMTPEKIKEEIVADASEAFFTDKGSIQAVVDHDRGLAQAIHDGIKTLLDTLLDLQDSDNLSKRGYGDFLDDIGILREAERMWLEALEDSRERSKGTAKSETTEKSEAKHSLKETDKEYLDAVKAEDWDKVREMVDKAAKDAGYTTKAYHGTPNKGFTVFDKNVSGWNGKKFGEGNYFSSVKDVAKAYSSGGAVLDENGNWVMQEGGVYDVYLDLGNPFTIDLDEERKKGRKGIRTYSALSNKIYVETAFGDSKYDSVVIKNIKDGSDIQSDVYVVKDSNRIKSADLVVRDDNGEIIPLSQRFNEENNDIRYSLKEDQDYMDAVNNNKMALAQSMVDEKASSIETIAKDSKGKPIHLFHGTNSFGFTVFKDSHHDVPFIYTSTDRTVSAHYAGDNHYASTRPIGTAYKTGNSVKDILENAKNVLGADMKVMTKADKKARYDQVREEALKVADRLDELESKYSSFNFYTNGNEKMMNAVAWVENQFWTIRDGDYQYNFDEDTEENAEWRNSLEEDVERFKDNIGTVREYYNENYKNLNKGEKALLSYLIGYDLGDVAIDIEYGMLRVATDEDLISNKNGGNIIKPSDLKENMDRIHNIGAYDMYGDLGDNPLEFDAKGSQFWAVEVPQMGEGYHDTDSISKWAYENGYTSVIMHNIYDYGDKADNYVFFSSNQLKSADPVTYDDQGNVIPLSERFNQDNEDIRYSLKDSDGNELTEAQQEYFKDSKVRDADGNLLVMYHGTNEEFTVFKANEFIGEQNGVSRIKGYFSTSREYSNIYGKTEPYYLNIKNPLFIPDEWKRLSEWEKWFARQGVKGIKFDSGIEMDGIKGYGFEDGTKGYALWDLFDSGNYWYGDGNLTEKIENAGYDGIYWNEGEGWNIGNGRFIDGKPLAYMPFNENAIKRIDNLNPTENEDIRYSLSSSFEAVGCDIRKENGMIKAFDSDGVEIKEFKPSYIRKSPLGRLLSLAVNKKILADSDVTQQTQFLSRLYNMILNTQDPDLIWAVSGTIGYDPKHGIGKDSDWLKESKSKFASITGNSDPQYDTTIDFTTICVKTQAIIDAMSKLMIDLGRGLTEHEIIDIVYKETARAGEQVPCPVCYVFSRWVGLGNLFGKIKQFQQDYPEDMDMTEVRKEYEKIKKQVDKLVSEQKGKKSGTKAREQLYAETIERKDLLDLKRQMPNKKLTEAEEKELEAINNRLEILDHWSWLEKTRLADDYKAVPDDVLFDLNAGRTFAMDYPATWRFRTTRGPSLGKAVAPYSPSRLGDTIRGIASPTTLGKLGNSNRVFLNKNGLSKTARNAYNKAIENAKRQNRMNGQRLQSTSDFRFEYGLDYLLSFIELEAIGAKAQMYTKVPEAVKFLASTGTEVNCSVMAKGSGVVKNRKVGDHYIGIDIFTGKEIETDQEYSLVFSDITGMSIKDALTLSRAYNNVQPILVGISRAHMIAAMANKYITMIIPFHSSGSSEGRYRSMMEAVGEAVEGRTPFEEYENEHDIENATPEQKLCRKLRVDILTGKFKDTELTDKEQQALKNNEILRQLFIRIYGKDINGQEAKPNKKYVENFDENGNDADCYGVYLTKKQAGVMMPYEYWDKHSTIKDADKQGEAYVKYCESLGITPVFSGWDSKGKYHEDMDFSSYPGYWKTLIDRKMYNNDGTYHKQQAVNVKNVDLDMLDSNAMKDGIFKPMQTQNTEKTQTIVERSKATIAAEEAEDKFSLKETDREYMRAVESNDMEAAQRLVDEAARRNGYTSELYHGTKAQFNSFDINKSRFGNSGFGIYFGDRWKAAEYGGEDKLRVYVKTDNLASSEKHNITARMFQNAISRLGIDPKKTYKRYVDTASDYIRHQNDEKLAFAIEDWAKDPKYYGKYTTREAPSPGEILSVMQETLGYDGLDRMPRELVLWDNHLVKLADPVVYDDNGNVIPLSERFNVESDDIRYQLKDSDSKDTIASQNTIAKLENQVKDLKAEFKRTDLKTADQKQARIQAGKLIQRHGSNMGVQKDLTDTFNKIFRLYKEKGTDAFDEVYEIAKDAAVNVVNNITEVHNEGREEYDAIKQYLRETPITISEDMKRNITDYNDFRKSNFGRLKIRNGETSNIDNVYMELMEMFPEQFTDDYVNPHDQLNHIVDVLDNFAPYYETLDGASEEMQDYVAMIAGDIMETAYNLQTKKTFADKMHSKVEKYQEELWLANERTAAEKMRGEMDVQRVRQKALESRKKALEKQKTRYEKQVESLKGELWKANERTAVEKMRGEMETQKAKQKLQDFKEQTKENAEKKRRIKQIANIHKRLLEKLQSATDTKHLPDGYAPIVSKVLKMFDFTTPGMEKWAERNGEPSKRYRYMMELRKQLQEMSENESGIEVDNDLIDLVDELTADIGENQRLADLDSRVLEDITTLFRAFEHQINSYNKMFVEGQKQTITEAAYRVFDEMKKDNKWKLGLMGRLMASNFNPSDFFTLIGGEIEDLYNSTRKGFDKYVRNMDNAREFIQSTVNNKTADKWANHTGTYKTASGEEVKLTDTQLMDLYVSSRREQAQGHIFFGGIISAPVKVKGKLKTTELEEKRVIPTQEDLTRWFGSLSKEQIKVAEAMQKYLTEVPSEWGNETSMIMYNYRKFGEKMYWPIQSSRDFMDSNFDQKGNDPTLKNISPSKATVKGANNAIVIDDIFTVFCKHIAQMASYNAYVPAISDFQRVWNFSEGNDRDKVKARFKEAYGKAAADYVEDFFKNLNGSYKNNFDVGIFDKGLGLFKKAAVGGNIRVLVQQPTAIARAALIVNPAYLAASIPSSAVQNKKVYQEMMEHCPIAKWKVWGFYSSDITSASRDLKNIMIGKEAFTDKVFMDMYGKADNVTWTVIFNACKMQVEAQNKGLKKGSDEYWEKVNDLASRVFDRTQVVDSPFHRSKIMKSQDKLVKMATSFLAEPTKTVNMLNTEMTLAMRELRAGHHGRAAGIFTRVGTVFVANAALLAVAQALVDAMRHTGGDDDKDKGKYKDRLLAYWKDNFKENMEILGMVPILKDVKSLWDGYDVARMDMSGVQKVIQSIQYLKKYYENPEESKYTEQEEWMNLGLTAMYAAGVPISNAKRDIEAAILTGAEATNDPNVALWFMKRKYQVNSKTKSFWIGSYFNALENGNEGLADNIKKYITSNGVVTDKDIEKAANKRRRENPTEEEQKAIDSSMQKLESSNIWKDATEDEKTDFTNRVTNMALGITNTDTESITKYAVNGLTNEQVILYKLALKKADRQANNNGSYDNDEKEAAIRMLERNYKLTEQQKKTLTGKKS